jgi:predicted transcriptional regulator
LQTEFENKRKILFLKSSIIVSNSLRQPFDFGKQYRKMSRNQDLRRSRLTITVEILLYCQEFRTQTSIKYNTNLNNSQLKRYMLSLNRQNLLEKKYNKYIITEKGFRLIELSNEVMEIMGKM